MAQNFVADAQPDKVQKVSLRGTLADDYAKAIRGGCTPLDALKLVTRESKSNITSYVVDDTRIIGKTSERYQFPPDW